MQVMWLLHRLPTHLAHWVGPLVVRWIEQAAHPHWHGSHRPGAAPVCGANKSLNLQQSNSTARPAVQAAA